MAKKIDPLNKKLYGAVNAILTVNDVKGAVNFYRKAFGFTSRSVTNGPDGKPIHAELKLRDATLMLSPEMPKSGARSAKTIGASPVTLYLLVEKVDQVVARAVKLGATQQGPVMEMFWGDRCGTVVDPEGYSWMIATHVAEPTAQERKKKMKAMMGGQATGTSSGS